MDEETKTKKPSGAVRSFTNSEILRNYAGAIAILLGALPAVGSLIVSLMTAYRGEPVAEKTWSTVRAQLNQQAEMVNKLHLRVIQLQAHEEGRTSAALQLRLEELQKKYDQLRRSEPSVPAAVLPAPSPTSAPSKCRDGYIRIKDRCRQVPKAVAAKVKADEQRAAEIQRKLNEETARRMKEEVLRRMAERKIKATQSARPALRMLPKKLDDAAKGD